MAEHQKLLPVNLLELGTIILSAISQSRIRLASTVRYLPWPGVATPTPPLLNPTEENITTPVSPNGHLTVTAAAPPIFHHLPGVQSHAERMIMIEKKFVNSEPLRSIDLRSPRYPGSSSSFVRPSISARRSVQYCGDAVGCFVIGSPWLCTIQHSSSRCGANGLRKFNLIKLSLSIAVVCHG